MTISTEQVPPEDVETRAAAAERLTFFGDAVIAIGCAPASSAAPPNRAPEPAPEPKRSVRPLVSVTERPEPPEENPFRALL
ncbi:hypothetical protein OG762_39320 [Streptomyces sp. NBC_01136]|uniref:hypothetical protein n=1 Tax=unclassified Streptomyces TaxID=2593676 RepID=UPI00324FEBC4|nr:hypothetical protein OG762_39320 [Streptomyces sp. NBC_01136]